MIQHRLRLLRRRPVFERGPGIRDRTGRRLFPDAVVYPRGSYRPGESDSPALVLGLQRVHGGGITGASLKSEGLSELPAWLRAKNRAESRTTNKATLVFIDTPVFVFMSNILLHIIGYQPSAQSVKGRMGPKSGGPGGRGTVYLH